MIRVLLALVALVACSVAVSAQNTNPQQQICAQPPKGCGSQKKIDSCTNWHGCMWTSKCVYDPSCANGKPTRVPTVYIPPTPPTPPTTMRPTTKTPTPPPTKCTAVPPGGNCFSAKTQTDCSQYRCCLWNSLKNPPLCQYNVPPSAAPTTHHPTTTPAPTAGANCHALRSSKQKCEASGRCVWRQAAKPAARCQPVSG